MTVGHPIDTSLPAGAMRAGLSSSWCWYFLFEARLIATRSKDPSTKCGACIIDPATKDILSKGYNGFPPGVEDSRHRLDTREEKYALVRHAEDNAIWRARKYDLSNAVLFIWPAPPCVHCTTDIVRANIKHVFTPEPSQDYLSRWIDSYNRAREVMDESGVQLTLFPKAGMDLAMHRIMKKLEGV